jgi:hypothetical protein
VYSRLISSNNSFPRFFSIARRTVQLVQLFFCASPLGLVGLLPHLPALDVAHGAVASNRATLDQLLDKGVERRTATVGNVAWRPRCDELCPLTQPLPSQETLEIQQGDIQPGKPVQNAYVESFKGRLRGEYLNANWVTSCIFA